MVGMGESGNQACGDMCVSACAYSVGDASRVCSWGGVYPHTAESLKVPVCVWELHVYEKM